MDKKDERLNEALALLDSFSEISYAVSRFLARQIEDMESYKEKLGDLIDVYERQVSNWVDKDDE